MIGIEAVASVVESLFNESNICYKKNYHKGIDGWIYEVSIPLSEIIRPTICMNTYIARSLKGVCIHKNLIYFCCNCIFQSTEDNGRLKIYCCDLFNTTLKLLGDPVDCVFDRGSYVAIERQDRKTYVKLMLSLMAPKFRYLLAAVVYDCTKFEGPPRHVERKEVTEFFTRPGK